MKRDLKMRVADYVASFFADKGITHVFLVTGGGAMHLNDALGREKRLTYVCCHHEQACAIAGEGFFRVTGRPAAINVTTGPGGANALTGVHGAFTDSIALVVLSGQVKRDTLAATSGLPLRQLGDQEIDIVALARPITKYAVCVLNPQDIRYHLEKAYYLATTGRPGPVWIDIPIDVQSAPIDPSVMRGFDPATEVLVAPTESRLVSGVELSDMALRVADYLRKAARPVVMPGSGVRIAGAIEPFHRIIRKLGIPVAPAFNAHDLLAENDAVYVGRPGTIGDRAGNFAVQNSDFLLVLGCRLNIRQISYNWKSFARAAFKVMVDIDRAELYKHTLSIDLPIHADLNEFLISLDRALDGYQTPAAHRDYLAWCQERRRRYPVVPAEYWQHDKPVNPYCFTERLFDHLRDGDVVVTGNGSACVITFQAGRIKADVRLFGNSGAASMGYDLPAAIGAAYGCPAARIVCLAGDGSIMMNLQELQTISSQNLSIKIFLLDNDGYHSIRQTQSNYFPDNPVGATKASGVTFPDFLRLAQAFQIPARSLDCHSQMNDAIATTLDNSGPQFCHVLLDPNQPFAPKLASRALPDGRMASPALEDMAPFLTREELAANMLIPFAD